MSDLGEDWNDEKAIVDRERRGAGIPYVRVRKLALNR